MTSPVALVIGAGSGIGAAVAAQLTSEAWDVVCADINEAAAHETAGAIGAQTAVLVDVCRRETVTAAIGACGSRLRTVVVAAGVLGHGRALDLPVGEFDRIIEVNLKGSFIVLQEAGRAMRAWGGSIVTFASVESFRPIAGHAHYAAAKAGVLSLTRSFADELAPYGVRVNAVAPGAVSTPMTADVFGRHRARQVLRETIPLERIAEPAEVAAVVAFLCSPSASYVTGACWRVDGGLLAKSPF